jgi:hypothetical protein
MIRDILLREYSGIQEQVNGYNAILTDTNYNPNEDIPYRTKDLIQEEADYYTQLRDAMRIVVNYYCAPSDREASESEKTLDEMVEINQKLGLYDEICIR